MKTAQTTKTNMTGRAVFIMYSVYRFATLLQIFIVVGNQPGKVIQSWLMYWRKVAFHIFTPNPGKFNVFFCGPPVQFACIFALLNVLQGWMTCCFISSSACVANVPFQCFTWHFLPLENNQSHFIVHTTVLVAQERSLLHVRDFTWRDNDCLFGVVPK